MKLAARFRRPLTPSLAGVSRGADLTAGSPDDGWTVQAPVTLEDGATLRLYKDGEALRAAYEAIGRAKHSVFIEFYIFADDATGQSFADLLARKAAEGVKVYLIHDALGSLGSERRMFRQMRRSGVLVRKFHPVWPWECTFSWKPFNRDHRKLVVVDGEQVVMGGLNVGDEYAGPWVSGKQDCFDFWRDCGISLTGPAVRHFAQSFVQTWQYLNRGGRIARSLYCHNLDFATGPVAVLASVPTMDSPLASFLHGVVSGATQSIDLTAAYFAPGEAFVEQLCRAAGRGARVRLMLPSRTDAPVVATAARSFYQRLMDAGIEVYERQHVVLHAKTLVVDRRLSIVGSTNLDYRSIEYNCELVAGIRSESFARQMETLFEHDMAHARQIHPQQWRKRPTRDRIIQWAANRSRYLL